MSGQCRGAPGAETNNPGARHWLGAPAALPEAGRVEQLVGPRRVIGAQGRVRLGCIIDSRDDHRAVVCLLEYCRQVEPRVCILGSKRYENVRQRLRQSERVELEPAGARYPRTQTR